MIYLRFISLLIKSSYSGFKTRSHLHVDLNLALHPEASVSVWSRHVLCSGTSISARYCRNCPSEKKIPQEGVSVRPSTQAPETRESVGGALYRYPCKRHSENCYGLTWWFLSIKHFSLFIFLFDRLNQFSIEVSLSDRNIMRIPLLLSCVKPSSIQYTWQIIENAYSFTLKKFHKFRF